MAASMNQGQQAAKRGRVRTCCASAYSLLSRNLRLPLPPPPLMAGPSPRSCGGRGAQSVVLSSEEQLHREALGASRQGQAHSFHSIQVILSVVLAGQGQSKNAYRSWTRGNSKARRLTTATAPTRSSVMTAVTPCAACSDVSVPGSAWTSDVKQRTTLREPAGGHVTRTRV